MKNQYHVTTLDSNYSLSGALAYNRPLFLNWVFKFSGAEGKTFAMTPDDHVAS